MDTFNLLYDTFKYNIFYKEDEQGYLVKLISRLDKGAYTILRIKGETAKVEESNINDYENCGIIEQNIRMILLALEEVEEEKAVNR